MLREHRYSLYCYSFHHMWTYLYLDICKYFLDFFIMCRYYQKKKKNETESKSPDLLKHLLIHLLKQNQKESKYIWLPWDYSDRNVIWTCLSGPRICSVSSPHLISLRILGAMLASGFQTSWVNVLLLTLAKELASSLVKSLGQSMTLNFMMFMVMDSYWNVFLYVLFSIQLRKKGWRTERKRQCPWILRT